MSRHSTPGRGIAVSQVTEKNCSETAEHCPTTKDGKTARSCRPGTTVGDDRQFHFNATDPASHQVIDKRPASSEDKPHHTVEDRHEEDEPAAEGKAAGIGLKRITAYMTGKTNRPRTAYRMPNMVAVCSTPIRAILWRMSAPAWKRM